MALADYAAYRAAIGNPAQTINFSKASLASTAGRLHSLWMTAPFTGATPSAPTTAAVPAGNAAGALAQNNAGAATLRLGDAEISGANGGLLILCDRLSHQGSLVGNVNTTQTTNLPTAALTRYTDGVGVFIGLEIYSIIGTTGATVTCSYTDDGNNSGSTTDAIPIGATGFREVGRMLIPNLAAGDAGARAVASVTLSASTGTAGNIGVTLFKPLMCYPIPIGGGQMLKFDPLTTLYSQMPEILDDACLFWMFKPNTSATGIIQGSISFFED